MLPFPVVGSNVEPVRLGRLVGVSSVVTTGDTVGWLVGVSVSDGALGMVVGCIVVGDVVVGATLGLDVGTLTLRIDACDQ